MIDHYIERILKPYFLKNQIKEAYFILDQARCHQTEEFRAALASANIEYTFIPASLTSLLQPADYGWFKPLKVNYVHHYNDWFINGKKHKTKHGNLAGPGYENMTKWILDVWNKFDSNQIINSFVYCGITSKDC